MAGLIRTKNYRDVLEIGTLYGYSTLHLAEAADALDGSVTTVDLRLERRKWHTGQEIRNVHEVAVRLIGEAGYASVVSFLVGNSNAVLPGLILEARQFDLIFVDGSHSFPAVVLDVIAADLLLRSDGVIILDDVSEGIARKDFTSGGPNRLLPSLFASGRFEIVPLSANHVALGQREAGR